MNDGILMLLILGLLCIRVQSGRWIWKAPRAFGAERFFGLPIESTAAQTMLRRYRMRMFVPYLPELLCLLAAYFWSGLFGLLLEQTVALIIIRIYHQLLVIHTIRQAKWLAAGESWQPVRSVALSLKARRLGDYTSVSFELVLAVLTVATLALLTWHAEPWRLEELPPRVARLWPFTLLMLYLQLGGLLVKHALVKWRMWLPGERTEEYLRWREAVLRYFLAVCDYLRCALAAPPLIWALELHIRRVWHYEAIWLLALAASGCLIPVAVVGLSRQRRRLSALWKTLQPLEAFSAPPPPIDGREFFLGGLGYCSSENPALLVPGPLVFAINLANKRAYLYSAYFAGLVLLGFWCVGTHHS